MHQIAAPYFNDITIWHNHVEECAHAVWGATGEIENHVQQTCRPSEHQQEVYSGQKRKHGMKYQSVYLPMGFYAHMPDPEMGARHNGYMLRQSNLEEPLENMFPQKEFGMSSVRECVEWGFASVIQLFQLLDHWNIYLFIIVGFFLIDVLFLFQHLKL
jgi:DDE superfamily endonuclease